MKRINETKDVTVMARKAEKIQAESGRRKAEGGNGGSARKIMPPGVENYTEP